MALAGLVALTAAGCTPALRRPAEPGGPVDRATVVRVIDGDTVVLAIGGGQERVRLLGVNTPESVSPTVPVQCYGHEASQALAHLLPAGTTVRVERDTEARDRYHRLLLYLYRTDDELFVNRWLVDQGYATTLPYAPNTTFAADLEAARARAQATGAGLWGACGGPDVPAG